MSVDLHCHILPGLDDGAAELEDSLQMARKAAADGIATICATPHVRHDHDVRVHEIEGRVAELQAAVHRARIDVRIAPGAEVAEAVALQLDPAELRAASLGAGGGWILLEPAPGPLSDSLAQIVDALALRGLRSLVAHPERHLVPDFADRLLALVNRGALVQATAASILDQHSGPSMLALAERGVVHVLGSDSHSARAGRPVALSAAIDRLAEVPLLDRDRGQRMRSKDRDAGRHRGAQRPLSSTALLR
jgi:protein-tyrosine phosphatase